MSAAGVVQVVGGLLPPDLLGQVVEARDVPGRTPADYHLAGGEGVREAAARSWTYLLGAWRSYRDAVQPLSDSGAPTTSLTRERWLLLVLRELGYGRVPTAPPGGLVADDRPFPVSHLWGTVPMHLLGWGAALDVRTKGRAGAATKAPQAMVQELLNRSEDHLWAVLSNGQLLRLLRDSTSLVGPAYVEFDLEAIFDGELFSDFVQLWLLCHQSRVEPLGDGGPGDCWLERWRALAIETGSRALTQLRDGVADALRLLGTGFVSHPSNGALRAALADGRYDAADLHRALLRLVYRLLFWFVAEDRNALLAPAADQAATDRYQRYFSSARLRRLAARRRGGRYPDLWQAVRIVFDGLGADTGRPELALAGLGGLFRSGPLDKPLAGAELSNEALLAALRALSTLPGKAAGRRRSVDYRHLGAEELGSVYESLLELVPGWEPATGEFRLSVIAGHERKTTGSYYTPTSLIDCLLDSALEPLLDEASGADDPEAALLALTVCDPACGSGHFLVAAARRIAKRLAAVRSEEYQPTLPELQRALRDVVARCIHGVDINPLAAELAKVSLWLEAMQPGRPMTFLDAHIRVGNALLGTTPALLAGGLPDAAFKPIEGDDRTWAAALARRNRAERDQTAQGEFSDGLRVANSGLGRQVAAIDAVRAASPAEVHEQERRLVALESDPERARAVEVADAWCSAFVWRKTPDAPAAVTQRVLVDLDRDPDSVAPETRVEISRLAARYRFFHWYLEFPHIFPVPNTPRPGTDPATGWSGGFSCMLGNPPWEHVELKEQEFFASRSPEIAEAAGAKRKRLITGLLTSDPDLRTLYEKAKRHLDGTRHFAANSGLYPLTGRGRTKTDPLFAESSRAHIASTGRFGLILPTGIATDATTQYFFRDLVETSSLSSLYDFENTRPIFEGVHRSFKFCLLTLTGRAVRGAAADFAFFLHDPAQVARPEVRFPLKPDEITLLNPNTGTCPIFRSRRDAEITLGIYRRVPVLLRDGDPGGNPWGLSFMQGLFNMTSDSGLFRTRAQLESDGWLLHANVFTRGAERMLPLYEGRMGHQYNHRFASLQTVGESSTRDLANACFVVQPQYWIREATALQRLGRRKFACQSALLGHRRVARNNDERSEIAAMIPCGAASYGWILSCGPDASQLALLLANYDAFVYDYILRNAFSQASLPQSTSEQTAVLQPSIYDGSLWQKCGTHGDWVLPRVLELTYTAWDMEPFARDLGDEGPPFRWDEGRRALLRAELDAAYFHLYGIELDDVDYILDTFPIVKRKDEARFGEYRTKRLILEVYDAMAKAIMTGEPYQTALNPPPGSGPRHPDPT